MKKDVKNRNNISNKLSYTLLSILVILLFGAGVYAYGTSSPATFGHSIGELSPPSPCSNGQYLQWSQNNPTGYWVCKTPSTSSSSGISNVEVVNQNLDGCSGGTVTASCPSGKKLISGGCGVTGTGSLILKSTLPTTQNNGWFCYYTGTPSSGGTCYARAVCGNY